VTHEKACQLHNQDVFNLVQTVTLIKKCLNRG